MADRNQGPVAGHHGSDPSTPTVASVITTSLSPEEVLWISGDPTVPVRSVGIYDDASSVAPTAGELLLAVNVGDMRSLQDAVELSISSGAAGLIVRGAGLEVPTADIAVVGISKTVPWLGLVDSLRFALGGSTPPNGQEDGLADLFALANAVSQQVSAPVIIEDRSMRLLAFSEGQESADPSRVDTILRRRPSQGFIDHFQKSGLSGRLYDGREPIYLEREVSLESEGLVSPIYSGGSPSYKERRAAIGVRAGSQELGAIWVAVDDGLTDELAHCLRQAAKVAALHILRMQAHITNARQERSEQLKAILSGHGDAQSVWEALDLPITDTYAVLRSAPTGGNDNSDALVAALEAFFSAHGVPAVVLGVIDDAVVGVVALPKTDKGADTAVRLLRRFQTPDRGPAFGLGDPVKEPLQLPRSNRQAEYALRAAEAVGSGVAVFSAVQMTALLTYIASQPEIYADLVPAAPVRRLLEHDHRSGSDLIHTLRIYVETLGNVRATAELLHVHTNTLRYRLTRILEITGLDLDEPDAVAEISLQLYLMRAQGVETHATRPSES